MATPFGLRQTRITILLSLNAVAILISGVLIAGALGTTGSGAIVAERSDVTNEEVEDVKLLSSTAQVIQEKVANSITAASSELDNGELWDVDSITLYQTADQDICIDDSLPGFAEMYWQTSNTEVIESFYSKARNYLGYSDNKCRFPKIVGIGKTTITAGTYDGLYRDSIEVTVVAAPAEAWKKEVLQLVNEERKKHGLKSLQWGTYCEGAAEIRAKELATKYDHVRPNGTKWSTTCPIPNGNYAGENLAAGSSTVSPATVVAAWMNSEDHKKNILNKNFRYLSVGFHYDVNSRYKVYWSQYFTSYNDAQ